MGKEKNGLTLEQFMKAMYGVKPQEPTPEDLENTKRFLEEYRRHKQEEHSSGNGPGDK